MRLVELLGRIDTPREFAGEGMTRAQADLAIAGCAVVWGLSFLFQKSAVEHVGPWTFVAARLLLAAAVLAPLAWREARQSGACDGGPLMGRAAFAGAALLAGSLFQQIGIASATVTNTGLLTGLYVVLTPVLAWAVLGRRSRGHVWIAAALSVAGVLMLGGGTIGGFGAGDAMVAVCALFWAIHLLALDAKVVRARPIGFTALHMGLAGLGALGGAVVAAEPISAASLTAAAPAIVYGGLLSSALTYVVLAIAMRHTTAAEVAVLSSLEVVVAAAAGAIILGERLAAIGWAGAVAMVAAGLVVQAGGLGLGRKAWRLLAPGSR